MEIIILTWSKWNETPWSFYFLLDQGLCKEGVWEECVLLSLLTSVSLHPYKGLGSSWMASRAQWLCGFCFFCFLVLPVYCYPPISLHPCAHMLSCKPMDCSPPGSCSPPEVQKSWTSPGKNTGVGCHLLLQIMCFSSVGLGGIFQDLVVSWL